MRPFAAAAAISFALALHADAALAAAPLQFSAPQSIDAHRLTAITCISEARCLAVDTKGDVVVSSDAAAGDWGAPEQIFRPEEPLLTSISCTANALCFAGDEGGSFFVNIVEGGWLQTTPTPSIGPIVSIGCAAQPLCAAVTSSGEVLVNTDLPPSVPGWERVEVEHVGLRAASCSGSVCVAAGGGSVTASTKPEAPDSWSAPRAVDPQLDISALSCWSGETCVAADEHGDLLASADAAHPTATWSSTPGAPLGDLDAVSCASTGLCLAAGASGEVLASDDATAAVPQWSEYRPAGAGHIVGVACLPTGLCVLVNAAGEELTVRAPAPTVATGQALAVSSGAATLTGQLNPEDAELSSCAFEYGTGTAYEASAPCSGMPAPAAGQQQVSAALAGLSPNTTYHYRLTAASARGPVAGVDGTFTTAVSSAVAIVRPHPSISGTPAVGSTLTCQSGLGAPTGVRFAYQWLRNTVAIPSATASSYSTRGADNGAHLQCAVTATDGGGSASATSAFVSVPYQSPPAADGETAVGRAAQSGARIAVPLTCAADASAGCRIVLRASTRLRGKTLALASGLARLPAARSATVALALTKTARKLLARRGRLAATVSVSGTVLGVIEAKLSTQMLTLTRAAERAKRAARRLTLARALPRHPAPSAVTNASPAAARPPSLSPTPYMGWDTYFAFGGRYDEATVLEQASRLLSLGLARLGYRYVWLDVGWWQGARSSRGQIEVNTMQWPHGMRWLASTLHAAGLRVGLYTDAGPNGCGGTGEGSYGHYQQDIDTFASWGFDAVKADFCGGAELHLEPAGAYGSLHQAILRDSPHRAMLLDVCDFLQPGQYSGSQPTLADSAFASYLFGPAVANSWRTDTDVGTPHNVHFADVLRNIDADAAAPQAAGPGHWNDPDYLAPGQGLSAAQFRTQLSMWSVLAAPLMISDDLDTIPAASLQSVRRSTVIAVDQDPAGRQGTLLSSSGQGEVWVKPLAGGARAIALLNRGSSPLEISTDADALALPFPAPYRVTNLWSGALSTTDGPIAADVPAQSTVLLRIAPA